MSDGRRRRLELRIHHVLFVLAGCSAVVAMTTGDLGWGLVSNRRCGTPAVWWALKNAKAFGTDNPLRGLEVCPSCGQAGSPSPSTLS
jgi:hypothetical protein